LWVFSYTETGVSNEIFRTIGIKERLNVKPLLTRFGPFDKPSRLSEQELPLTGGVDGGSARGHTYHLALDSWAEPTTIWALGRKRQFSGNLDVWLDGWRGSADWSSDGFQLLVEKEGRWVSRRNFAQEATASIKRVEPVQVAQRLYVNPRNARLYVLEQDWLKSKPFLVEINPETGKVILLNLPFDPEDLCFDMDGRIYLRTDVNIVRYDPDTWHEIPWDYGEEREQVSFNGKPTAKNLVSVLPLPGGRPVCFHQGGLWISPRGHLAVSCFNSNDPELAPSSESWRGVAPKRKLYTPTLFPGRACWQEVHVWDKHGKAIRTDMVPGLFMLNGLAIDAADNIYAMAVGNRMIGGKPYPGLFANTLMKFKPGKGRVLCAGGTKIAISDELKPQRPPDLRRGWYGGSPAWVEGADWLFGGVGYDGFNGGQFTGRLCGCMNSRFTLDNYSRSFAPDIYRSDVAVLDSNGNLIMRIGRYGNVEDGVPLQAQGGPPGTRSLGGDEVGLFQPLFLATHSDRRLFIADYGNFRILSVKLGYHAEEKVTLKNVPDRAQKQE
jgi:hypothetical protein